jgi:hypothetical protein
MVITAYQVENVLRTYSRQLQRSKLVNHDSGEGPPMPSERVTISEEAKQRLLMDRVKGQALEQARHESSRDSVHSSMPGEIVLEEGF